ncbi:PREDICTED: uncharacterized protein K02A2.6-like [Rhagoletis zephyria]|uniref:uncharacterized protein K02A2.6-like n=1 Tax=Rhagoletis zephyria TaxID=28612 RepID=UPI0008115ED5|nr:PREDICTED: uncharacterized protein K02A2.6-like [Rhagoletis zephyria]
MEFQQYCQACGIQQIQTPPYWPQANGEVENMNKNLDKRLKIAQLDKKNYKEAIQNFMLMYNVTPHGSTGTAPSELMFGRVIRDKIPSIQDLVGEFSDSVEKDRDCVSKHKGKVAADRKRGAKEVDIEVGDKVYLKNVVFPHKLTPNFDTTEYEVMERKGNIVKVVGGGRALMRNVAHLKKIPAGTGADPHNTHSASQSVAAPLPSVSSTGTTRDDRQPPLRLK